MSQVSLVTFLKLRDVTLLYHKALKRIFNAFLITLLAFLFVGCALHSDRESNATSSQSIAIINAETPKITSQPQSAIYNVGDPITPLSVTASVSGSGGTLFFQWYKAETNESVGSKIDNAANPTFTPTQSGYYYVVVTNTNNNINGNKEANATSNAAKITIECLVSFYDANLDFNGSISVQANRSISIAQLKTKLDLNATALYLANGIINQITKTSYQVTQNVNFYAVANVQEIKTQTELSSVRNKLSSKYILLNDIELTSATLDDLAGWNPIGYYNTYNDNKSFTGIFNGNGYVIRNLWIDRQSTTGVGLLGSINNAQIRNLGVEINSSKGGVKGQQYVGGIAGAVNYNSSITNSYSAGNVSGNNRVGGIAGVAWDSTIENSAAINKEVNGSSDVNRIVGDAYVDTIQNNFALNTMATNYNGGVFPNTTIDTNCGTDKSDLELKTQSTYSNAISGDGLGGLGWKFGNDDESPWIWGAFDGYPYPALYWQKVAP